MHLLLHGFMAGSCHMPFHLGYTTFRDESNYAQADIEVPKCTQRVKNQEHESKAAALMEDCGVCRE